MRGSRILWVRGLAASITGLLAVSFATETWAAAMENVVVSTRKRDENLQEIPVAVEVIGADEIERKGLINLESIVEQSSSLNLKKGFSPQDIRITIRGLSPTRGRQNVAVLQDGIDVSSEAISTAGGTLLINPRLFDLERVEIVKGPQNALFGRSAFAGAINYITKKPGDEFEANVRADVASENSLEAALQISGPLTSNLSAGISAMTWQRDGYYQNALTGNDMGEAEGTSVAGTLVWNMSDALSFTARVENLNDSFGTTPFAVMDFNAVFPVPQSALDAGITATTSARGVNGKAPDADQLSAMMSEDPRTCVDPNAPVNGQNCGDYDGTDRNITRGTLTIDWDLGPVVLTSLTHLADVATSQKEGSEDVSASTATAAGEIFFWNNTDLFSQEIRLSSNNDGAVSWVVGAQYWDEDKQFNDGSYTCLNYDFLAGGPFPPNDPTLSDFCAPIFRDVGTTVNLNADFWQRQTEHKSIYGLVEWQFLESWKVAFEGRQTWEDTDVMGPSVDNSLIDPSGKLCLLFGAPTTCPQIGPGTTAAGVLTPTASGPGSSSDDFFAPKATLTWTPVDNQLYYFSWAEAYKPKGISLVSGGTGTFYNPSQYPNDPIEPYRFDQEKLIVYELGAKTSWMDNRVVLNGALFFQDFKNKQVSTQIVDSNGILSSRVVNAGKAEVWGLELEAGWVVTDNLSMSLSYTYLDTEYTDYVQFTTGSGTIAYVGNCTPTVVAGTNGCNVSYNGNELEDAPKHAAVANARYQRGLVGVTDWFVEGDLEYQDDRFDSAQNNLVFGSYSILNMRVGVTNEQWDIIAYVNNVFDDDTVQTGFADGDIPNFQATGAFLNHGTLYMPDPRVYGVRLGYRFGAN